MIAVIGPGFGGIEVAARIAVDFGGFVIIERQHVSKQIIKSKPVAFEIKPLELNHKPIVIKQNRKADNDFRHRSRHHRGKI